MLCVHFRCYVRCEVLCFLSSDFLLSHLEFSLHVSCGVFVCVVTRNTATNADTTTITRVATATTTINTNRSANTSGTAAVITTSATGDEPYDGY